MITQRIKQQFERVLDEFDVEYEEDGVLANLREWDRNKAKLISVLSKHPNWNEEAQAIILTAHECAFDVKEVFRAFRRLTDWTIVRKSEIEYVPSDIFSFSLWDNPVLKEFAIKRINVLFPELRFNTGMKTSRALNKLLRHVCDIQDEKEYLELFCAYSDAINAKEIEHPFIISANPSDFLTMSYGNSWASCHIINPGKAISGNSYSGCYKAGTLSYINDPVTVIAYTVKELPDEIEDLPLTPRLTRQCFIVDCDQKVFFQSRQYPETNNEGRATEYREIVQKALADVFGVPNFWKVKDGYGILQTGCDAKQYPDYDYHSNDIKFCYLKQDEGKDFGDIIVGETPYCLKCGEPIRDEAFLYCDSCDGYVCDICGGCCNEDDMTEIGGQMVCRNCLDEYYTLCDFCGNYVSNDEVRRTYDTGEYICPECYMNSNEVLRCDHCGDYYIARNITEIDGENVCRDCIDGVTCACEQCGEVHLNGNMSLVNDRWLCDDCEEQENNRNENAEVA